MYKNLYIITNTSCNQSCNYCYYRIGAEKRVKGFLDPEKLKFFLNEKVEKISLTGGEPLLNPYLFDYLKIIKPYTSNITLSTNGKMLTENLADRLISAGVNKFFISLDSLEGTQHFEQRSGSSKSSRRAIDILLKKTVKLSITSVITAKNINEIFELQDYCNQHNIKFWPQPIFIPTGNNDLSDLDLKNISKVSWEKIINNIPNDKKKSKASSFLIKYFDFFIRKSAKKTQCEFTGNQFVINANGDIKHCFHGKKIGSIKGNTLKSSCKAIVDLNCFNESCLQYLI